MMIKGKFIDNIGKIYGIYTAGSCVCRFNGGA